MDNLQRDHRIYLRKATRLLAEFHTNKDKLGAYQYYLLQFEQVRDLLSDHSNNIEQTCIKEEDYELLDSACRSTMLEIGMTITVLQEHIATKQSAPSPSPSSTGSMEMRLPALPLPTFSGEPAEWPSFAALFREELSMHAGLSGAQKLRLLSAALTGKAKNTIADITPTSSSFDTAWTLLVEKYENKRDIAYSLVNRVINHVSAHTADNMESLIDTVRQVVRAMANMGYDTEKFLHTLLIVIILGKLPADTKVAWDRSPSNSPKDVAKTDDLLAFLQNWQKSMLVTHNGGKSNSRNQPGHSAPPRQKVCPNCTGNHSLSKCENFINASLDQKWDIVKNQHCCSNCLCVGHRNKECNSTYTCHHCQLRHHTMLHRSSSAPTSAAITSNNTVLLATARICVKSATGEYISMRALLDPGSHLNLITKSAAHKLGLTIYPSEKDFNSATGQACQSFGQVTCEFKNQQSTFFDSVAAEVTQIVAGTLPTRPIQPTLLTNVLKLTALADPSFYVPTPVDLLLGAHTWARIVLPGQKKHGDDLLLQETEFGWTLQGAVHKAGSRVRQAPPPVVATVIHPSPHQFWELEEIPTRYKFFTAEEQRVENNYSASTVRLPNGQYQVAMSLATDPPNLGASRHVALQRYQTLEKKFQKNQEFAEEYKAVINEYIDMGHIEQVPRDDLQRTSKTCYLPHHAVVKPSSTTTKLRVVFDASCKTSNGNSLNDCQSSAPNLLADIFSVIIRFRSYPVAISADVSKMYRRILIRPEDRDLQRILWRPQPKGPIVTYRLTTVTFGQKIAPYLAIRTLHEVAKTSPHSAAARAITEDFYMDDCLTGASTVEEAIALKNAISETLLEAGLPTHKWSSNVPAVTMPGSAQVTNISAPDAQQKTLGIMWNAGSDTFHYQISQPPDTQWSRRSVLSYANTMYDPAGWLAPFTLVAKLFIQVIVKETKDWDEPLPTRHIDHWTQWIQQSNKLVNISLPRCVIPYASSVVLVGFADASERAYGAVVYVRIAMTDAPTEIRLVASRTKVSPLKPVTLPRLELMAAHLLANLLQCVSDALSLPLSTAHAYSDSTITLAWLASHPSRWKTFVANRVADITNIIPVDRWAHVNSQDNPADLASRGATATEIQKSSLWWHGPSWLVHTFDSGSRPSQVDPPEEKSTYISAAIVLSGDVRDLIHRYGSYRALLRVVATVYHGIDRMRGHKTPYLTREQFAKAEHMIIRWTQEDCFPSELASCRLQQPVRLNSPLAPLNPIFDNQALRLGGRLTNAHLPHKTIRPYILPSRHHVTRIIIRDTHEMAFHAGPMQTWHLTRKKYWVLHGLSTVKSVLSKCIDCVKNKATLGRQMMAALPAPRVQPSRPFSNCGVDYLGPLSLKTFLARGNKQYKAWIALFICFSTRAVHLELVSSMSTAAFLAAFNRFVSRRGLPSKMYSDRGTNFVGASNSMNDILTSQALQSAIAERSVTWHFNPAGAPHFGGLWEAGVRSTKYHLSRILHNQVLTYEEMLTVMCKVEAILNSRPLLPLSDDPDDLDALTPGHFLIGGPLIAIPSTDITAERLNTLDRWQLVERIGQDFWKRWSAEFLSRLHQRPKWWRKAPDLKQGDLVLVHDATTPCMKWRMGRVTKTHPGADGAVRVATIATANGTIQRPVQKLVHLPLDQAD